MPVESILVGAIVTLLCAAMCFYVYSRLSYTEKKVMMLESILVDVKMAMDSLFMEGGPVPAPIASVGGGMESQPAALSSASASHSEEGGAAVAAAAAAAAAPEDTFYSSVLAAAHDDTEGGASSRAGEGENLTADEVLEGIQRSEAETAIEGGEGSGGGVTGEQGSDAPRPNYDAMTKQELLGLSEQRGLRTRKTMTRGELINLLRSNSSSDNRATTAGSLFPDAAAVDGDYPVDLGQA